MMKMKPLITAISIAIVSASVSAVAAPADNTRTLPVRKADSMPTIAQPSMAKKVSLNVQENRSSSLDGRAPAVATPALKPKSPDRMTQLIDEKQEADEDENDVQPAVIEQQSQSVSADNMSVEELARKDVQSDSTDDISDGQAVAAPSATIAANLPADTSIKSIEDVDGKKHTTLNLSNYAKQVNGATWTPNMKVNSAMTIKMQALLDWNHASPGAIDGGWGMNSKKA